MGELPTLTDVQDAIRTLKNNKAAGPDGIPAEIVKDGEELLYYIHALLLKVLEEELPAEFRDV